MPPLLLHPFCPQRYEIMYSDTNYYYKIWYLYATLHLNTYILILSLPLESILVYSIKALSLLFSPWRFSAGRQITAQPVCLNDLSVYITFSPPGWRSPPHPGGEGRSTRMETPSTPGWRGTLKAYNYTDLVGITKD